MRVDPELAYMQLQHLARWMMAQVGMPSMVVTAPEDGDDCWRIGPAGGACIGQGKSLAEAADNAMEHPQVPAIGEPLCENVE